jgi:succinate dehydrogenase / fumarate reductase iron-sulfur subunit
MFSVPERLPRAARSCKERRVRRAALLKNELGIGYCNITKCCTEVCPEEIRITDNAIIPLKERVVDEYYDPVLKLVRKIMGAR